MAFLPVEGCYSCCWDMAALERLLREYLWLRVNKWTVNTATKVLFLPSRSPSQISQMYNHASIIFNALYSY